MATRPVTVTRQDEDTIIFNWDTLTTTDADGEPIPNMYSDYADRNCQVSGAFGGGGNLRIAGSNQSAYVALNDPFGTALNITAASVKGITEIPLLTRPEVTAGDGTTDLDVTIVARRSRFM